MLEWLVLLAGTLLFIINLSAPREHATNPPPGDQTVVLPADLVDQLAAYKTLLVASTSNPNNTGAVQATANAKTQIDMELAQWQEDVATMQNKIQKSVDVDTGLGSDVAALHQRVASYEKTLPELQDTLTKSNVLTADKVQDTTMMVAKAVAITVIGLFAVFVSGLF